MNGILLRWLQIQCGLCLLTCAALGILLFQYSQNVAIKSRSDRESETTIAIASKIDEMRKLRTTAQVSDESDKDKWDAQLTLTQVIEQTEKLPQNKSKGEG